MLIIFYTGILEDALKKNKLSGIFATDVGSRYGVAPQNCRMVLLHKDLLVSILKKSPERNLKAQSLLNSLVTDWTNVALSCALVVAFWHGHSASKLFNFKLLGIRN